jgi:hypothetical protein
MQTLPSPSPPSIFFHQHHFNCTRQGIRYRWCFAAAPASRPCRFRYFFSNRNLKQPLQKRCTIQLWHLQKSPWACVHVLPSAATITDLTTQCIALNGSIKLSRSTQFATPKVHPASATMRTPSSASVRPAVVHSPLSSSSAAAFDAAAVKGRSSASFASPSTAHHFPNPFNARGVGASGGLLDLLRLPALKRRRS